MGFLEVIIIIWLGIYILIILLSILKTKKRIKKIFMGKAVGIFGAMGTGKDALQTAVILKLQKYNKSNVYSNIPYKLSNGEYSNILNPRYIDLKDTYAPFPFEDKDIISISEAGMVFPSEDFKYLATKKIGTIFTTKFIRHLFNGSFILNEQSPNRIWVQQREKLHSFIKINSMKKGIFWLKFKILYYDNIEDYGKMVYTKHELKKLKFNAPSYDGECYKLTLRFNKRKVFNAYSTRAFAFLGTYKKELNKDGIKKGIEKPNIIKKFTSKNLTIDDLRILDLNRLTFMITNTLEKEDKKNNEEEWKDEDKK